MYSNLLNAGLSHLWQHDVDTDACSLPLSPTTSAPRLHQYNSFLFLDALNSSSSHSSRKARVSSYEDSYRVPVVASTRRSLDSSSRRTDENKRPAQALRRRRSLPAPKPAPQRATPPLPLSSSVEYLPAILSTPSLEDSFPFIIYDDFEEDDDARSIASSSASSAASSFLFLEPISTRSRRSSSATTLPPSPRPTSPPLSPSRASSQIQPSAIPGLKPSLSVYSKSTVSTKYRRNKRLDALAALEGRTRPAAKHESSFVSFSIDDDASSDLDFACKGPAQSLFSSVWLDSTTEEDEAFPSSPTASVLRRYSVHRSSRPINFIDL